MADRIPSPASFRRELKAARTTIDCYRVEIFALKISERLEDQGRDGTDYRAVADEAADRALELPYGPGDLLEEVPA